MRAIVPDSVKRAVRERQFDRRLIRDIFHSGARLYRYRRELNDLHGMVDAARMRFFAEVGGKTARGHAVSFGHLGWGPSGRLYALVRELRPSILVETGVCNGVSSSVILSALARNGEGRLFSIDYPEYSDGSVQDFDESKRGAVVPVGKQPGWLIPDDLRERWELTIGKSQEELPPLLARLGTIDFFMHDSEHSYDCMTFEMTAAIDHLRPGGLLVVDDARWNGAFEDFIARRGLSRYDLGSGTEAAIVAP